MKQSEVNNKKANDQESLKEDVNNATNSLAESETPIQKEEPRGVVVNCLALVVREEPDLNAEVAGIIYYGYDTFINEDESTNDFYKIRTKSGIEGFCCKDYIEIQ